MEKRTITKEKVIFSVGTGNWFCIGEQTGRKDLERLCVLRPYSTYELREIVNVSNKTGVSIDCLGETLDTLCLDGEGNAWLGPQE